MQLIIFIGIQATGKSTFYLQNFYKSHVRLNLDMLRTRHREKILFEACLVSKTKCVIDNTNPTRADRQCYILSAQAKGFEIVGYYFQSNLQDALERNATRQGKEKVPEIAIRATHQRLEIPNYAEGFTQLHYVELINVNFNVKVWHSDEF